jgi:2-methylcitrate dehydratase PrpD
MPDVAAVGDPARSSHGHDRLTRTLAEHIVQYTLDPHDDVLLATTKRHLRDALACSAGAATSAPARPVVRVYAGMGGRQESGVLGTPYRLPAVHAAGVNGHLGNLLDFDDSELGFGHPAPAVMPVALALGERESAASRELLAAIVVGHEVAQRVSHHVRPSLEREAAVWGYSTWQILGGVAAGTRLLRLDVNETMTAIGIACTCAPVPFLRKLGLDVADRPFSWVKNNYGWAAMAAVHAGLLARDGFVATRNLLDGDHGFWAMAGSDRHDDEALVDGLGEDPPRLLACGLKPHACCLWTHTALDAVRQILSAEHVEPAAIKRIEVRGISELAPGFAGRAPRSIVDAQFHLPHLLALELLGRSPSRGPTRPTSSIRTSASSATTSAWTSITPRTWASATKAHVRPASRSRSTTGGGSRPRRTAPGVSQAARRSRSSMRARSLAAVVGHKRAHAGCHAVDRTEHGSVRAIVEPCLV